MIHYSFIVMKRLAAFHPPEDFRNLLASLADFGYEGAELNLTEPIGVDLGVLERWLHETRMSIPSFMTGEAYSDGLCLSSPDPDVRNATVERLISYLDVAERFDSLLVVGLLRGLRSDEPHAGIAEQRIVDCLSAVAEVAEKKGRELVLEPVNHLQVGFCNSVAEVMALIGRIGSPVFRPMVDTIHMNIEETSLTQPIFDCGKSLRHVHLCESNGGAFGSGNVDFAAVLKALEQADYDGFASMKVYRHLEPLHAARHSMEYLRGVKTHVAVQR